jgi:hypothetical protein
MFLSIPLESHGEDWPYCMKRKIQKSVIMSLSMVDVTPLCKITLTNAHSNKAHFFLTPNMIDATFDATQETI